MNQTMHVGGYGKGKLRARQHGRAKRGEEASEKGTNGYSRHASETHQHTQSKGKGRRELDCTQRITHPPTKNTTTHLRGRTSGLPASRHKTDPSALLHATYLVGKRGLTGATLQACGGGLACPGGGICTPGGGGVPAGGAHAPYWSRATCSP